MGEFSGLRVLLVEDEAGVAILLETMLEDLGCEIAASAARMNRAFEAAHAETYDFAVLDVNVAGETSFELARLLWARGTPFVFSTGYGVSGLPEDLKTCSVLAKPFSAQSLSKKIRESLSRGGASPM